HPITQSHWESDCQGTLRGISRQIESIRSPVPADRCQTRVCGGVSTEQARGAANEHGNNEQPHSDELKDRSHALSERIRRWGCRIGALAHPCGSLRTLRTIPIPDGFCTCGRLTNV